MKGLVAYGDDENDSFDDSVEPNGAAVGSSSAKGTGNMSFTTNTTHERVSQGTEQTLSAGGPSSAGSKSEGPRSTPRTSTSRQTAHGIAIRRPPTNRRSQPRAHISNIVSPSSSSQGQPRLGTPERSTGKPNHNPSHSPHTGDGDEDDMEISPPPTELSSEEQELSRLRAAMRPKDIPGVRDWGIPPAPTGPVDEEVATKLAAFMRLKRDPVNPKHFNDSLMSNKAFRNPHLYANLVDWADVDEKATNFPKDLWDPYDLDEGWYVEALTEAQKKRADKEKEGQKKRSHINFTSGQGTAGIQHGLQQQLYGASSKSTYTGKRAAHPGGKPTRWGPA